MATRLNPLGFIGIRLTGGAMAEQLLDNGYNLVVWTLEPELVIQLINR